MKMFTSNRISITRISTYLKLGFVISIFALLSGCRVWDMANFQWQNANAKVSWNNQQGITKIPFTLVNDHILVEVEINGNKGFRFVLDSGAAATVITETAATHLLDLPVDKPLTISGSGNGEDPTAYIVQDMRIAVGDFAMNDLSVIFAPTTAMPFDSIEETYFDGVLGADFFNCCYVEINHDQQMLFISQPTQEHAQKYALESWQSLDIDVESNTPYLTTKVEDDESIKTVKVMLDTGSTGTLSLFAGNQDFIVPNRTFAARTSGISGDTTNQVGRLKSLAFGQKVFDDLPTYFRLVGSNPQSGSHGVLGNQVMQRFNLTFDFSGERIWVQPSHKYDSEYLVDRSGLRILPHKKGAILKDIASESAGETLNIPINSIVTRINGGKINRGNFDELTSVLSDQNTKQVAVCWLESSQEFCGTVMLKSRL